MNPSRLDKGNQDEKRIAPIVIKLDLLQLISLKLGLTHLRLRELPTRTASTPYERSENHAWSLVSDSPWLRGIATLPILSGSNESA
jgi:hypothetical protein